MPDMANSTMLWTPSSVYFWRSFFSISNGATESPISNSPMAFTSATIGLRLAGPTANRYDRPVMPAEVSRSISTRDAALIAPVLVRNGRRIGAATARTMSERMVRLTSFIERSLW